MEQRAHVIRWNLTQTALAASPFLEITPGAGRPVRLRRMLIQSAGSTDTLSVIRATSALTGGTSAAATLTKADTTQPDMTMSGKTYSAASTGGGAGPVTLLSSMATAASPVINDFTDQNLVANPTQTLLFQMGAATAMRGWIEFEEVY